MALKSDKKSTENMLKKLKELSDKYESIIDRWNQREELISILIDVMNQMKVIADNAYIEGYELFPEIDVLIGVKKPELDETYYRYDIEKLLEPITQMDRILCIYKKEKSNE